MSQITSGSTDIASSNPFVLTLLGSPGSAALRIENTELPPEIQVDEKTHHEVARRLGAGVQIYDCDPNTDSFKFREPQANLYDLETGLQRGIHFVGLQPGTAQWTDMDGSRVVARVIARVDAPPPADPSKDVQWLKLEVIDRFGKTGIFEAVTLIQRVLTYGGKPSPSCQGATIIGEPYATLYIFWASL